ncbi:MAG: hypothetical protein EAZ47_10960, partial [Bacteroidetes bacterium]
MHFVTYLVMSFSLPLIHIAYYGVAKLVGGKHHPTAILARNCCSARLLFSEAKVIRCYEFCHGEYYSRL